MLSESRIPVSSSTTSTLGLAVGRSRMLSWPAAAARCGSNDGEARAAAGSLSTNTRPRCASIARCTTARPSPLPPGFVVKNGSNIRSRSSVGMPGPSSDTRSDDGARLERARRPGSARASAAPPRRVTRPVSRRRRLHGVEREVEDRAMQQILVAFDDQRSRVGDHAGDAHVASAVGVRVGEPHRGLRDLADVRRARRASTRTRAKSRNSESSRDSRSDSRMIERARACADRRSRAAARADLLDRAADRRERILDLVRERRAQLRDRLEPLGAQAQHLEALLVGDVLEDRGARTCCPGRRRRSSWSS